MIACTGGEREGGRERGREGGKERGGGGGGPRSKKTRQTSFSNLLGAVDDTRIIAKLRAGTNDSGCYGGHEEKGKSRPRRLGMF